MEGLIYGYKTNVFWICERDFIYVYWRSNVRTIKSSNVSFEFIPKLRRYNNGDKMESFVSIYFLVQNFNGVISSPMLS